jgi:hypothetical protein
VNVLDAAARTSSAPTPTRKLTRATRRLPILHLGAVVVMVLSGLAAVPSASADGGCIPGNIAGQVPRLTRPSDNVCVPPSIAQTVQDENAAAAAGKGYAGGGAYGPLTCVSGLVWREGYDGDGVCVSPQRRQETWQENANAGVGATGGLKPQPTPGGTNPGGTTPQAGTPGTADSALLAAVNDARVHPEKYPPLAGANGKIAPGFDTKACPPFNDSSGLSGSAATHIGNISNVTDAVLQQNSNAHRNPPPNGLLSTDPGGTINQAGYHTLIGEIVAWGFSDPASAVVSWMQKDGDQQWGHRNNIMNCNMSDAGAASLGGGVEGHYWVVDMGTK